MQNKTKTPFMRYLELRHGEPVEVLITRGSPRQVAKRLGVSHVTVWKWLRRLEVVSVRQIA